MNNLILVQKCDEEKCPIGEQCPIGPTPNMPCALKEKHMEAVKDYVREVFPDIDNNPVMQMSSSMALIPLHRQLMNLYLVEHVMPSPLIGAKINPILGEIRKVIKDIQLTMNNMIKLDATKFDRMKKATPGDIIDANPNNGMVGSNYYEMLLSDGKTSVNEPLDMELMS